MVASRLMLVPESMRELFDMSERIGAVVAAAAAGAAIVVVEASWDMEACNSAMTLACTVAS